MKQSVLTGSNEQFHSLVATWPCQVW